MLIKQDQNDQIENALILLLLSSPAIFSRRPQRQSEDPWHLPRRLLRLRSAQSPRLLARPPRLRRALRPQESRRHRPHRLHQDQRPPAHRTLQSSNRPPAPAILSHIAFTVSNAEQMRAYLASSGIPVGAKVGKGRTGDLNFEIKDPDGNLVEFVEPQPDGMEAKNAGKFLPATRISDAIYHLGFLVGNSAQIHRLLRRHPRLPRVLARQLQGNRPQLDRHARPRRPGLRRVHALQRSSPLPTNAAARNTPRSPCPTSQNPSPPSKPVPPTRPTRNLSTPTPASTASVRSISSTPTALASN